MDAQARPRGNGQHPRRRPPRHLDLAEEADREDRGRKDDDIPRFARRLIAERKGQVSDNHLAYQEWTLGHLLPYFADWPLEDIDIEAVDAYRHHKVREAELRRAAIERCRPLRSESGRIWRPLSAGSINKAIGTL